MGGWSFTHSSPGNFQFFQRTRGKVTWKAFEHQAASMSSRSLGEQHGNEQQAEAWRERHWLGAENKRALQRPLTATSLNEPSNYSSIYTPLRENLHRYQLISAARSNRQTAEAPSRLVVVSYSMCRTSGACPGPAPALPSPLGGGLVLG